MVRRVRRGLSPLWRVVKVLFKNVMKMNLDGVSGDFLLFEKISGFFAGGVVLGSRLWVGLLDGRP